jgi:hypothetical protein
MRKLVDIKDIYTQSFGGDLPMMECPFISCARELYLDRDKDARKTLYFHWLQERLNKHGHVWQTLQTEDDLLDRVEKFRMLVTSLEQRGYVKELEESNVIDGIEYGKLIAEATEKGYRLIDGHHRLSVMIVLGYKMIDLELCE